MAGKKGKGVNGDPRDNSLENLEVLHSQAEHARLHGLKRGNDGD
ncbi:MAG: hypothetical protein ACP5RC_04110 [Halothiobacillaceae bacterium]